MDFVEELRWRGLLNDLSPGTEEKLKTSKIKGYIGFDPTAPSLHIGNLIPIILLKHFQNYGHTPVILMGGATGLVGDPSGKNQERKLLDSDFLNENIKNLQNQLQKFLHFDTVSNPAEIVNNYQWFEKMNFIEFIRDIGKLITVNYMLAKDSVNSRLQQQQGLSFTEFCYQLVQGYDFYWLFLNNDCLLQMGGSDQWGNITTGTEIIRKKIGGEAFCLTSPLITKADGGKFGKTERGNIWLDPTKTSPYLFYQFWINSSDEDAKLWIKYFTFLSKEEILQIEIEHQNDKGLRILQKKLACELTRFVHGEEALTHVQKLTNALFGSQKDLLLNINLNDWNMLIEGLPLSEININLPAKIVDIIADANICPSKSEAKKLILNGGLLVNKEKIVTIDQYLDGKDLLFNHSLLIQKGKKNYSVIKLIIHG